MGLGAVVELLTDQRRVVWALRVVCVRPLVLGLLLGDELLEELAAVRDLVAEVEAVLEDRADPSADLERDRAPPRLAMAPGRAPPRGAGGREWSAASPSVGDLDRNEEAEPKRSKAWRWS